MNLTRRLLARLTGFIALSLMLIGGTLNAQETGDLTADFDATVFGNRMRDIMGTDGNASFVDSSGRTIIPLRIENGKVAWRF